MFDSKLTPRVAAMLSVIAPIALAAPASANCAGLANRTLVGYGLFSNFVGPKGVLSTYEFPATGPGKVGYIEFFKTFTPGPDSPATFFARTTSCVDNADGTMTWTHSGGAGVATVTPLPRGRGFSAVEVGGNSARAYLFFVPPVKE